MSGAAATFARGWLQLVGAALLTETNRDAMPDTVEAALAGVEEAAEMVHENLQARDKAAAVATNLAVIAARAQLACLVLFVAGELTVDDMHKATSEYL